MHLVLSNIGFEYFFEQSYIFKNYELYKNNVC